MKKIKVLSLTFALGFAGAVYAVRSNAQSVTPVAQQTETQACDTTKAKDSCCVPDASCCKGGSCCMMHKK